MSEQPRSRRQTRAAILGHLLQSGGVFRPPLARAVRLSEASLSRILFDLKAEGLIEEVRRPAPYVGGPTGLVSLDSSVRLAAFELTGHRLSVGVGGPSGELHYTERLPLPKSPTVESVGRLFHDALQLLADWTRRRRVQLAQIGVSVPGLGPLGEFANPIVPCDTARDPRHGRRQVCRRAGRGHQFGDRACDVPSLPHRELSVHRAASVRLRRPGRRRRLDGRPDRSRCRAAGRTRPHGVRPGRSALPLRP